MDNPVKLPTIADIKNYLDEYGWKYRESSSPDGQQVVIITPYALEKDRKGILLSFRVEGEFVVASTVGFMMKVPAEFAPKLLAINDRIKLVKLFSVATSDSSTIDIELGFELWKESWHKETFFCFIEMLCLGIEVTLEKIATENIPHQTNFINFGQ